MALNILFSKAFVKRFLSKAAMKSQEVGERRSIHEGGCLDGRSKEEGNNRPMIRELGS